LDSRVDLDIVGALENADKSSCVRLSWDYLRHYEWMLTELRDAPINLIEIGVAGGPSMRIWRWFFSQAQIIGIDIDPNCKRHAGDRVKIEIGSQIDPVFLDRVCAENPPTVIVDDGSHIMEHMIFSFEHLFPKLLPGGIYIVEDFWGFIGVDAMEQSTEAGQNAPEYFLQVARCCFAKNVVPSKLQVPPAILAMVDNVVFAGRTVMLRKKHAARDVTRALATADAYAATHKLPPVAMDNVVAYVLAHGGPDEVASERLESVIDMHGRSMARLVMLGELKLKAGERDAAVQLAEEAAGLDPHGHTMLLRLAKLQEALGDIAGALRTAEAVVERRPKSGNYRALVKRLQSLAP
jgi:hypothetical protein